MSGACSCPGRASRSSPARPRGARSATPPGPAAVRARLGVPDGAPLLVAVGRQEPQKGSTCCSRRCRRSGRRSPTSGWWWPAGRAGTAALAARRRRARRRGDVPRRAGRRARPPRRGRRVRLPSGGGGGGTLLEAMALECPVVASGLPTLREVIDPSTARLVRPATPGTWPGAGRGARRPRRAARRARAARARFEQGFTVQATARRWAEFYDRVARGARRAGARRPAGPAPRG